MCRFWRTSNFSCHFFVYQFVYSVCFHLHGKISIQLYTEHFWYNLQSSNFYVSCLPFSSSMLLYLRPSTSVLWCWKFKHSVKSVNFFSENLPEIAVFDKYRQVYALPFFIFKDNCKSLKLSCLSDWNLIWFIHCWIEFCNGYIAIIAVFFFKLAKEIQKMISDLQLSWMILSQQMS